MDMGLLYNVHKSWKVPSHLDMDKILYMGKLGCILMWTSTFVHGQSRLYSYVDKHPVVCVFCWEKLQLEKSLLFKCRKKLKNQYVLYE